MGRPVSVRTTERTAPMPFTAPRPGQSPGLRTVASTYISLISPFWQPQAEASRAAYQDRLTASGLGRITTDILEAPPFYYAEDYHQQYLAQNPNGYCGLGGTGVSCQAGVGA